LFGVTTVLLAFGLQYFRIPVADTFAAGMMYISVFLFVLLFFQKTRRFSLWFLISYFGVLLTILTASMITGVSFMMMEREIVVEKLVPVVTEEFDFVENNEESEEKLAVEKPNINVKEVKKVSEKLIEDDEGDSTNQEQEDEKPEISKEDIEIQKSWKHIADSLTKYLIYSGEKVAIVENCPAGYEEAFGQGSDKYICKDYNYINRWLEFEWKDGRVVRAPEDLSLHYLMDFQNPGGSTFQDRLTSDESHMIYLDFWSRTEPQLVSYDIDTATQETLMSFLAVDHDQSCDGIRFFGFNKNETKLGIIVSREAADDTYPTNTKVFILTIEDGKLISKNKYNFPVVCDSTPNNGPSFTIGWIDSDTIAYYDPNINPVSEYTEEDDYGEYYESLYYSNNRWRSEYVKYFDVK
jgi:hypothetical protein